MNQTFYRFGGTTKINQHVEKFAGEPPKLNSTFNTILSSKLKARLAEYNAKKRAEAANYDKAPMVRVQDYTKNLSQGIFSPSYAHGQRLDALNVPVSPMKTFGYRWTDIDKSHGQLREV